MQYQHFKLLHQVFNYSLLRYLRNCLHSIQQSTKAGELGDLVLYQKGKQRTPQVSYEDKMITPCVML